jgi:hypothetical protein
MINTLVCLLHDKGVLEKTEFGDCLHAQAGPSILRTR